MPKTNTLYAYFDKSPKTDGGGARGATSSCASKNSPPKKKKPSGAGLKRKAKDDQDTAGGHQPAYQVGDLVWAKLEGYPWWPSVVCQHPTTGKCVRYKKARNSDIPTAPDIHVSFYDDPPSRAWLKENCLKRFNGYHKGIPKMLDPKWQKAFKCAEAAGKLSPEKRILLARTMSSAGSPDGVAKPDDASANAAPKKQKVDSGVDGQERVDDLSDVEDSEEEFKPNFEEESDSEIESLSSDSETPRRKRVKKDSPKSGGKVQKNAALSKCHSDDSARLNDKTKTKLSSFASLELPVNCDASRDVRNKIWAHTSLEFLKEGKRRDLQKRLESHDDYDAKTLHVPDSFLSGVTPAMRQWWELKSRHFDAILFFKVGKFYELYHMDAVVGVNELNLVYMKGDFAHAGFPEIAYGRYAASLVERGYRVARVEQTETPAMAEERCKKKSSKFDKVVRREVCQVTTKGTRRYGFQDVQSDDTAPAYLLAVTEKSEADDGKSVYGVCFVDTSIGQFHLGQFGDDRHSSHFRTLIAHCPPAQILYEKGNVSKKTLQILKTCLHDSITDALIPKKEFWDSEKTLKHIAERRYFTDGERLEGKLVEWPSVFRTMQDQVDSSGFTVKVQYDMAIRALGACTWFLGRCLLDDELLTMKNFVIYEPVDASRVRAVEDSVVPRRQNMVLDGITLRNLDLLQNKSTGKLEGTLLSRLDHCSTLAGKRLLRHWISLPLFNPAAINQRLDAVADLMQHYAVTCDAAKLLKKVPDLERLLSKIHGQGSALRSRSHPDSRAVFFDDHVYSKRKILDFLSALNGFQIATEVVQLFKEVGHRLGSKLLKRCVTTRSDDNVDGMFPDLKEKLLHFENAFDHEKAKKDGKIIPLQGVDAEYDDSVDAINGTMRQLNDYLHDQCQHFHCKVTYCGSGRNRFQLEVPDRAVKYATEKYELQGQRKGFKRYWTLEIKNLLSRLMNAEEKRDSALRDVMRRVFASFSKHYETWSQAVRCLATLDILMSLARYSQCCSSTMCRPEIIAPSDAVQPFLEIRDGSHPCISAVFSGGNFIPNDTVIGLQEDEESGKTSRNVVVVTGPNMGGKSTLMRQVGLIVVMAQMGCYVPAEKCRLTPVDRLFTRLGASDNIMLGESTFFVELSETASILRHATRRSLVLIDELGRGTSTYDGIAIAHAVLGHLAHEIRCRTLFSTHYHCLVDQFSEDASCHLGHMACLVENENVDDPTQETITFLYKFASGACPKSYGFNAAKLAGIESDVIQAGYKKSKQLEDMNECVKIFKAFHTSTSSSRITELLSSIKLR